MKIHIINGGPRKNWNTAQMCEAFAAGAKSAGAEAEIVPLYDLDYRGCYSCFACKLKNGWSYGKCGYPDGIHELLEKVSHGDGVVFASPIYFGDVTAQLRAFLERLAFPFVVYDQARTRLAPKHLETAVIYTMNVGEEQFLSAYIGKDGAGPVGFTEKWIGFTFSPPERICAFDTFQFDYDRYVSELWDAEAKAESRKSRFPQDLENARQAGIRMAEKIKKSAYRPYNSRSAYF